MRKYNVNFDLFKSIVNPEIAYFLGLLWADGCVRSDVSKVKIYAKEEDLLSIKSVFDFVGTWCIWRNDDGKNKVRLEFSVRNKDFYQFLIENDYYDKSLKSPCKILSKIPDSLHPLFFRGWLDGDGCICVPKTNKSIKLCFAGNINQDWTALEKICNKLNLKYGVYKTKSENGSASYFNITKIDHIIIFGEYLYKDFNFGFKRKYDKFIEILKIYRNRIDNKKGYYYDNYYKCYKCSKSSISGRGFETEIEVKDFIKNYKIKINDKSLALVKITEKFILQ